MALLHALRAVGCSGIGLSFFVFQPTCAYADEKAGSGRYVPMLAMPA